MIYSGTINNSMLNGAIEMMRAEPSDKNRSLVLEEVLKARFLCPVVLSKAPLINEKGDPYFAPDCDVQYQMLQNAKGEPYLIAFTNQQQYEKWMAKRTSTTQIYELVMEFTDYMNLVIRTLPDGSHGPAVGVVIDPYGCNLKIDRDMIANLVIRRMQMDDYQESLRTMNSEMEVNAARAKEEKPED